MHSSCAKTKQQCSITAPRGGFVLVMALVLIVVAGVSLAGLARRSLELAAQATTAQEDLQRRWGEISCRRALLAQAEELLEGEAKRLQVDKAGWPVPASVAGEFTLGQLRFTVLLADEDAKVNLNAVYRREPNNVGPTASMMLQSTGASGLNVRMQLPTGIDRARITTPLRGWGQVFEAVGSQPDSQLGRSICHATREVTCWGGGRLNIRRSSDLAIQMLGEKNVPHDVLGKLLTMRRQPDAKGLDDLLSRMALKTGQRLTLQRLLTEQSQCHSLWIIVESERRAWTTLIVSRPGQGAGAEQQTFTW